MCSCVHCWRNTLEQMANSFKSGKKKAHEHNLVVRLPLGQPRASPRDQLGFSPSFTQWKPSLSQGQTRGRRAEQVLRTRSTTTRDRNLQFQGDVSTGFFKFSPLDLFSLSPAFLCNSVRRFSPNVEKIARFLGGEESTDLVTSLTIKRGTALTIAYRMAVMACGDR